MQKKVESHPSFTLSRANFDEGAEHPWESNTAIGGPGSFLPWAEVKLLLWTPRGVGGASERGQAGERGTERDRDLAGGRKPLSKAWPCHTAARDNWPTAGWPPSTGTRGRWGYTLPLYTIIFPPWNFLPAKQSINHPAAVSVEKSNSRFPC